MYYPDNDPKPEAGTDLEISMRIIFIRNWLELLYQTTPYDLEGDTVLRRNQRENEENEKKECEVGLKLFMHHPLGCLIPAGEVQAQRALDVARERGYQLEERYQPAGSIMRSATGHNDKLAGKCTESWPPASMTKIMTILLAYEEIKAGNLELESTAEVNEKDDTDIAGMRSANNKCSGEPVIRLQS